MDEKNLTLEEFEHMILMKRNTISDLIGEWYDLQDDIITQKEACLYTIEKHIDGFLDKIGEEQTVIMEKLTDQCELIDNENFLTRPAMYQAYLLIKDLKNGKCNLEDHGTQIFIKGLYWEIKMIVDRYSKEDKARADSWKNEWE